MLQEKILLVLALLFAVSMLSMLSIKLKISYPIFLVLAGLVIGFIPGFPDITLDPEFAFLIFLPPLLYAAAWNTSWKDFWTFRRPIGLLSFGLVIFTSTAIAFIAHALIPGFSLSMGFLLGAIISPPDAIAATSVLRGLNIPKRVLIILEGESLVNDASSLIVFRFALAAIFTGQFSFMKASTEFFLVSGLGILIGLGIAFIIYLVHRLLPTTAGIDTAITLISPYLMYISAEHLHCSGVMAVVTGGLFLSFHSHEIFAYDSRIKAGSFWEVLSFLLNGVVFILIGLQLPQIVDGMDGYSLSRVILYALLMSLVVIIIRIIWVFPGAYLPRMLSKRIRKKEKRPDWKGVFLVAWSGMRGVVSLASALAVPFALPGGARFPNRELFLFIAFVVILITLVLQGLTLPWVIRKLKIEEPDNEAEQEQELAVRIRLAAVSLGHLEKNYINELDNFDAYKRIKDRYVRAIDIASKKLIHDIQTENENDFLPKYRRMLLELITIKREELILIRKEKIYDDDLLRNKEWELDLEEARLNE